MFRRIINRLRYLVGRGASESEEKKGFDELIKWAEDNNIGEERIPRDTEELAGLTRLDLSFRRLQSLPDSIGELTQLTELDLRGNELAITGEHR